MPRVVVRCMGRDDVRFKLRKIQTAANKAKHYRFYFRRKYVDLDTKVPGSFKEAYEKLNLLDRQDFIKWLINEE